MKGLFELCKDKRVERGYVVTKSVDDFGPLSSNENRVQTSCASRLPYFAIGWASLKRIMPDSSLTFAINPESKCP